MVDYSYGFSGDVGGGPYDRRDSSDLWLEPAEVTRQCGVTRDPGVLATSTPEAEIVADLPTAIARWNDEVTKNTRPFGVIVVMDSDTYAAPLTGISRIEIPAGARLAIVAGAWPEEQGPGEGNRRPGSGAAPRRTRCAPPPPRRHRGPWHSRRHGRQPGRADPERAPRRGPADGPARQPRPPHPVRLQPGPGRGRPRRPGAGAAGPATPRSGRPWTAGSAGRSSSRRPPRPFT